jgi:DnaJ-class molecular chaperone
MISYHFREKYDRFGADGSNNDGFGFGFGDGHGDPSMDFFASMFGAQFMDQDGDYDMFDEFGAFPNQQRQCKLS